MNPANRKTNSAIQDQELPKLKAASATRLLSDLSDLLEAGCQLQRALYVLNQQSNDPATQKVVESLRQSIVEGASLANAMDRLPNQFNQVEVGMIRAAETGGFLQQTLHHLAEDSRLRFDSMLEVRRSLTYPFVLLLTAIATVIFLMSFVVPRFTTIYASAGADLPLPTRVLLAASRFTTNYWIGGTIGICVILIIARYTFHNQELRNKIDWLTLRSPIIGPLIINWQMSRFSRTMSLLLGGGLPVLQSLVLTSKVIANNVLREQVERLAEAVTSGRSMGEFLENAWPFPPSVAEMVHVAEESGRMQRLFTRLDQQFRRRFTQQLGTVIVLIEPIVILIVGSLIGLIVAAMLLPVLLMNTLIE